MGHKRWELYGKRGWWMNIDWNIIADKGALWIFFIGVLYFIRFETPKLVDKFIEYRRERDTEFLRDKESERVQFKSMLEHIREDSNERDNRFSRLIEDNTLALKRLFLVQVAHHTSTTGQKEEVLYKEMRTISGENITQDTGVK